MASKNSWGGPKISWGGSKITLTAPKNARMAYKNGGEAATETDTACTTFCPYTMQKPLITNNLHSNFN